MDEPNNPQMPEPKGRPVGGTEFSWCKAVPGGTGVTVLALLLSKSPDIHRLQTALRTLQNSHPAIRSKLHFDAATNGFSYVTLPTPYLQIEPFNLSRTADILRDISNRNNHTANPFHLILEHELNQNAWLNDDRTSNEDYEADLFFARVYTLSDTQWVGVLRLHTSACDRSSAVVLLRELLVLMGGSGEADGIPKENEEGEEVSLGIEDLIPSGKANKPFWARGVDVLGYSLNSFRLANLNFVDAESPRQSLVARLQMNADETERLVAGCKSRGIKLWAALAAAALIAARSSKDLPDHQREKYAVVTLIDCRSILDPVLSSHHLGFYHSAILNTHDISLGEDLWEMATRSYEAFENAKKNNKHFTDMSDLNYLMCKAIENPALTPSASMRTALLSVFEEPVIDDSNEIHGEIGLDDYLGCASAHGVGPSIAIFDTIRNGCLDCACVYPSPLHSGEQMQQLIDNMKRILIEGES